MCVVDVAYHWRRKRQIFRERCLEEKVHRAKEDSCLHRVALYEGVWRYKCIPSCALIGIEWGKDIKHRTRDARGKWGRREQSQKKKTKTRRSTKRVQRQETEVETEEAETCVKRENESANMGWETRWARFLTVSIRLLGCTRAPFTLTKS